MDEKESFTEEDKDLFAKEVRNVRRLKVNKVFLIKKPAIKSRGGGQVAISTPALESAFSPVDLNELAAEDWVGVDEQILFHRSGIQDKLLKKLARGQLTVEAKLDLHRLTLAAALAQAEIFLQHCRQRSYRLVLLIHEKGKKSTQPILKNGLNVWLRTQKTVLAFHSAQPREGGTGAVYVLIKSKRA